jgi:hypothetical protein
MSFAYLIRAGERQEQEHGNRDNQRGESMLGNLYNANNAAN